MMNEDEVRTLIGGFSDAYEMLNDDVSKHIYLAKLNYNVSHNREYIDGIVEKYLPQFEFYNARFCKHLNSITYSPIVLYGAGSDAAYLLNQSINHLGIDRPLLFCDRDERLQANGFFGYKVISPDELLAHYKKAKVIITTSKFFYEIKESLVRKGFNQDQIINAHNISAMYLPGFYFDMPFLHYGEHEIFVDAGAYHLEMTMLFKMYCKNLKKVYAFEANPENFRVCEQVKRDNKLDFVNLCPYGTWSKKDILQFDSTMDAGSTITENGNMKIEVVPIDDVVGNEKVTFIKMDIEGAELESLRGAQKTIKKSKPKLAISIYHKPEDMVTLPLYIKSLVPEYKLYIRHLSNYWTETVLFATL